MAHTVLRLALRDTVFEGRTVSWHSAQSALHAREQLARLPQVAVVFINMAMENDCAGLDLVHHIRSERGDRLMRIVLCTGAADMAHERTTLQQHDINAFIHKANSDVSHLYACLLTSLRAFSQLSHMQAQMRVLEALAASDALTGLGSLRELQASFGHAVGSARRRAESLCLVFLDVNDFKRINDEQGHLAGDEVLRAVGRAILFNSREEDKCFRYGGDEFVILLASCTAEQARVQYCHRLHQDLGILSISASVGVAQTGPDRYDDLNQLLQRADADMYAAKRARKVFQAEGRQ